MGSVTSLLLITICSLRTRFAVFTHSFICDFYQYLCITQSSCEGSGKSGKKDSPHPSGASHLVFSSNDLDITIDFFFPLKIGAEGLSGVRKLNKIQGILGEGTGNQEVNLTLRSTEAYSPGILCVLVVYDEIVSLRSALLSTE